MEWEFQVVGVRKLPIKVIEVRTRQGAHTGIRIYRIGRDTGAVYVVTTFDEINDPKHKIHEYHEDYWGMGPDLLSALKDAQATYEEGDFYDPEIGNPFTWLIEKHLNELKRLAMEIESSEV